MEKYIVYLRAVNVGGSSVIKMDDLRRMFLSFGLSDVQTYIQSGNVIFAAPQQDSRSLEMELESKLGAVLGFPIGIFLRTWAENEKLAKQTVFKPKKDEVLHIVFLRDKPDRKTVQAVLAHNSRADEFVVLGREIFNLRHDRDNSVFSNAFIEKITGSQTTTRNWNTVWKIAEKYK